jgi:hypothetical protein
MANLDVIASAYSAAAVTPNNSTTFSSPTRGLYVGVTGDVKVDMPGSSAITFVGLAAGIIHPICATRVYSTGTTATSIVAIY